MTAYCLYDDHFPELGSANHPDTSGSEASEALQKIRVTVMLPMREVQRLRGVRIFAAGRGTWLETETHVTDLGAGDQWASLTAEHHAELMIISRTSCA
jgi:hypothetical protein